VGPKKRTLHLLAARARNIGERIDAVNKASDKPVTCKRGCAHCCYQAIFATAAEAAEIYRAHGATVEALLPAIRAQASAYAGLAVGTGLEQGLQTGADVMALICAPWWARHEACAFLDLATNECRIYASRPVACRAYQVVSDPVHCGTQDAHEVEIASVDKYEVAKALDWANAGQPVAKPLAMAVLEVRKEMRR
jgi:Fe-S-cluster containining protein